MQDTKHNMWADLLKQ